MTVTTFSELELDESLLEALQDKGFTRPTAIQAAAIPPALDGRDVLGSAPTGTGKTAAYLLPALQHLLDFPRKKSGPPRILILTPTRELAMQVADHARELAKHTHLDIATITGGVAYMNHAEVFSENQDIVVATTGRLLQYIKEENFDCRAVETLILDEADRMLDMGFAQDIEHIAGETRWRKQTLLFSATLEGDAIQDFAERLLEDPVEVSANPSTRERKKIHQWYYRADDLEHKTALLVHLLKQPEATRSIVFVRKRERVHELANWLREAGITVDVGVCEDECKALISPFATAQTGRPYVTLKWAQSADGLIDSRRYPDTAGRAAAISGRMTQMLVHKLRSECSAVMVGTHTALMDDPSLTVRHWTGDNPVRVVIDRHGTLPRGLHLFDGTARTIVYTTDATAAYPGDTEVVALPLPDDGSPAPILADLASRQIQTLLVEGGAATLRSFIDIGLWDEARVETNLGLRLGQGTPAPVLTPGKALLTGSLHAGTSRIDTYHNIG